MYDQVHLLVTRLASGAPERPQKSEREMGSAW